MGEELGETENTVTISPYSAQHRRKERHWSQSLENARSTCRRSGRPEYETCSNETLERIRFSASPSGPIASDKDKAIAPISVSDPCVWSISRDAKVEG